MLFQLGFDEALLCGNLISFSLFGVQRKYRSSSRHLQYDSEIHENIADGILQNSKHARREAREHFELAICFHWSPV
jgi:hypothetical protein